MRQLRDCVSSRPIFVLLAFVLFARGWCPCAKAQPFQAPPIPVAPAVEMVSPRIAGQPFLRVWRPEEYNAAPGSTCTVQHPATGLIYVGNGDGVLEFDGARWRLLPLPGGGGALAMAVDAQERIWIAGEAGVSRLEPDGRGVLRAVAVDVLPKGETNATSVLSSDSGVWLACVQHVVRVAPEGKTTVWSTTERFGNIWWMDDAMHVVVSDRDVARLEPDGGLTKVFSREQLRVSPLRASPLEVFASRQTAPGEWLLLTALGPVRWSTATRAWRPLPMQPPLFREQEAIAATFLQGGLMAFTGPRGGVTIVTPQGRIERIIDRMPPVVGPRILNLFEDREGGLWIAARDRTARLQLRSAFARHDAPQGVVSSPRQMLRFRDSLYLAHSESVSRYIEWPGVFPTGEGLREGADAMAVVGGRLMAAAGGLVEVVTDIHFERWSNEALTSLSAVWGEPDLLLAGDKQGLLLYRHENNEWKKVGRLAHPDVGVAAIFDSHDGWIWGATIDGRLWRLDFRFGAKLDAPIKFFGVEEGVTAPPRGAKVNFFRLGRSIGASTARWFLRHDWPNDRFLPEMRINGLPAPASMGAEAVGAVDDMVLWIRLGAPDRRILHVLPNGDGRWHVEELPAPMIRNMPAVGLYQDRQTLWILGKDQLVSADLDWKPPQALPPMPRIRRVLTDEGDTLWADGTPISNRPIAILAGDSSVRFELAANTYTPDYLGRPYLQYRTQLVGLDRDWTPWSPEPWRDFTQLPPGRYRLRVEAGQPNAPDNPETSFAIFVPAPWWLTPWAWIAYALAAFAMIWGIVTARTRALRLRASELESIVAARTEELRRSNVELARLNRLELDEKIAARLGEEKARLEVLRYQLNPHFLYNALNSIYGLVLTTPRAAADMVLRLSDFCRATLTRSEGDTLSMQECFERVSLYLSIEKVRWKESLHVEMQLDEPVRELRIPPFLLQPLVENAVKYGGSTSPEELFIRVTARLEPAPGGSRGGWLVIEIANSGEWIEPSVAKAQGNTGLGHINLRQRLERTFPGKYEFETKSAGGWVTVRIRLLVALPEPSPANVTNPS